MKKQEIIDTLATRFYKVPEPEQIDEKFGIKEYRLYPWAKEGDNIYKQYVSFCVENEGEPTESAYWSGQEPKKPIMETFTMRTLAYIKEKVLDGTIKYGYLVSSNDELGKGIGVAITPANVKKDILLKETAGVISITIL